MAIHFHKLRVKEINRETRDCVSILLDVPGNLVNNFAFRHGQNVTIRHHDGEELRRSYSICSSPSENELRIAVKKVTGGTFSSFANEVLKTGDYLEVLPPTGSFTTPLNASNQKSYLFFAAGSGITPVISIIKEILRTETNSTVTLVYGNKNVASIIFKDALEALKDKYISRFQIVYVLSREKTDSPVSTGRIDKEKCLQLEPLIDLKNADEFFICGPEAMIFSVRDHLLENGVEQKKIHFELFTTPARKTGNKPIDITKKEKGEASDITIKLDGRSFDFKLEKESNNILDAALAVGADLPFSCKGGVCTTCKSRLVEGEVTMETNYGLEAEEIEAGFVLTCQCHPVSKKVVLDFDVKS